MKKNEFTTTVPATRVTPEMRERVLAVAGAAGCDMADVIRDSLEVSLIHMELALQLKTIEDYDDEELRIAGLGAAAEERKRRAAWAEVDAPPIEDRTRGSAWGATPAAPVQ